MKVSEKIEKLYPMNYSVIAGGVLTKVYIEYEQGAEFLQQELQNIFRRFTSVSLCDSRITDNSGANFTLSCSGESVKLCHEQDTFIFPSFPRSTWKCSPVEAAAWIIYVIAANRESKAKLKPNEARAYEISVRGFSSIQQSISENVYYDAIYQLQNGEIPDFDILFSKLKKVPAKYTEDAPRFSNQPIKPEIWRSWNGGLLKKKEKNQSTGKLAKLIYGFNKGSEIIDYCRSQSDSYVKFVVGSPEYKRKIQDSRNTVRDFLGTIPCGKLNNAVAAIKSRVIELNGQTELDMEKNVRQALDIKWERFSLSPGSLSEVFAPLDEVIRALVEAKLHKSFYKSIFDSELSNEISDIQIKAVRQISDISQEMGLFCGTKTQNSVNKKQTHSWRELVNLTDAELQNCNIEWKWSLIQLNNLQMNLGASAWLCPQNLLNIPNVQLQLNNFVSSIPVNAGEENVWAVWSKPLLEE